LAQYNRPSSEVIRRFRDFAHLEQQLADKHKGIIIPPLPEKNAVQKFQMSSEFIEDRRRALQVCWGLVWTLAPHLQGNNSNNSNSTAATASHSVVTDGRCCSGEAPPTAEKVP
jgi:hypothetical protein